ncbi:hypothetical protein V8G54_000610 [Vigna mungo]|uniref:Uncharacterized protein n=1 Tax=Vigna mungo TaxID=3915 RepID=A0AAQ3SAQ3_VIGMU
MALCGGILPLSLFLDTSNSSSFFKFRTFSGMLPLNLFFERLIFVNVSASPSSSGIFPESPLSSRSRISNSLSFPIDFGIDPPNGLCDNARDLIELIEAFCPMLSSMGPQNLLLDRSTELKWPSEN